METIISYFKERYEEENSRFNHMELKCSMFLRFITILLGAIGAVSIIQPNILKPDTCTAWITLVLYLAGAIFIAFSWSFALVSIKIIICPVMPKTRKTFDHLKKIDEETRINYLLKSYIDTLEKLGKTISFKVKYLKRSYYSLAVGAAIFGVLMIFKIIQEMSK